MFQRLLSEEMTEVTVKREGCLRTMPPSQKAGDYNHIYAPVTYWKEVDLCTENLFTLAQLW